MSKHVLSRRRFLRCSAALGGFSTFAAALAQATPVSVENLPALEGRLRLYLGRGEGGLYENVINAIRERNPALDLSIRRGPTAALANAIVAESRAGVQRADLFWAVDAGALALVQAARSTASLPASLTEQLSPAFRYDNWMPVTGRVRTIPYNTDRVQPAQIPDDILALPDAGFRIGWAPAYASFQSFVTAMRLLIGETDTAAWLRRMNERATRFAGELGVVMAVERGEVDLGLANHYYTLRLKSGKPDASVALAFTRGDAGCLVNASGVAPLTGSELAINFMRYLLTREVQSYLAREAYEIPLVEGVPSAAELPDLQTLSPPELDLRRLADMRPTLDLMRDVGIL